jgi:hypothetical protein
VARRAEDLPPSVVVIEDEFSSMADDEYRAALMKQVQRIGVALNVRFARLFRRGDACRHPGAFTGRQSGSR